MKTIHQYSAILSLLEKVEKLVGKTFIQKGIFILQEGLKEKLEYDYRLHYYGPYSQELSNDINFLQDIELINIDYDPTGYGYHIGITESGRDFLKEHSKDIKIDDDKLNKIIELIGKDYSKEMELLGTTLYFAKLSTDVEDIKRLVNMVKPHFEGNQIGGAIEKLREKGLIN